jgi:lipoprotein signal peptidase
MAAGRHTTGAEQLCAEVREAAAGRGARQRWVLGAGFAVVIGVDQAVKWWAWRHVDGSLINGGGYILLGPTIRSWFADPVIGAVADFIGAVVLIAAVRRLLIRPRPICVLIGGGLAGAGWVSNILDRLWLHHWTAPASARGVVDFIPGGGTGRCNVADLCILVGTLMLGYALARGRVTVQPHDASVARAHRAGARIVVLIVVLAVLTLAVSGAMNHDGVYSPRA